MERVTKASARPGGRIAVDAELRRPDFMIIGAMKAGTSTLESYLRRHPDVFMCYPKEPEFFSRKELDEGQIAWYFSLFREARRDQICGEASTGYSRWPYFGDVAARIHGMLPEARFIYVMRHPVERAYSHYRHEIEQHRMKDAGYTISFERAIEEQPVIFETSLYRRQVEKYLEHYPRDRLLLLFFEDLTHDPASVLRQVQTHLRLKHDPAVEQTRIVSNPFGSRLANRDLLKLEEALRRIPGVSRVVKSLLPPKAREQIRQRVKAAFARRRKQQIEGGVAPLELSIRRQLLSRFAGPNRELEELLGHRVPASWSR